MADQPISLSGHTNLVTSTVFTPDESRLLSGSWDDTIKVWSVRSAAEEYTLRGHTNSVLSLSLNGDGSLLASGSGDFTAKLWSMGTFTELKTFQGHAEAVSSVALSADGNVLATASTDRTVRIWDPQTGAEVRRLDHPSPVRCLAITRDGTTLATSGVLMFGGSTPTGILTFWDLRTFRTITSISRAVLMDSLAFTPDGKHLAVGLSEGDFDGDQPDVRGMVEIWDGFSEQDMVRWQAHVPSVPALSLTEDATLLATGGPDREANLWAAANGALQHSFKDQQYGVNGVAISRSGRWLASGGGQSPSVAELHLWDLSDVPGFRRGMG